MWGFFLTTHSCWLLSLTQPLSPTACFHLMPFPPNHATGASMDFPISVCCSLKAWCRLQVHSAPSFFSTLWPVAIAPIFLGFSLPHCSLWHPIQLSSCASCHRLFLAPPRVFLGKFSHYIASCCTGKVEPLVFCSGFKAMSHSVHESSSATRLTA